MDINLILSKYEKKRESLLSMLQDIQKEENYLSKDYLKKIAEDFSIPLSEIYSLATYYKAFSLKPKGKYIILVCMGTACHVRGSEKILHQLEFRLGIKAGDTTSDGMFSIETVNCLGACALGPLVVINNDYYGEVTPNKVDKIIEGYEKR